MDARGVMCGLTRFANKRHITRAGTSHSGICIRTMNRVGAHLSRCTRIHTALEAMAYQSDDVLRAMEADLGKDLEILGVDGGATMNNFLQVFRKGS